MDRIKWNKEIKSFSIKTFDNNDEKVYKIIYVAIKNGEPSIHNVNIVIAKSSQDAINKFKTGKQFIRDYDKLVYIKAYEDSDWKNNYKEYYKLATNVLLKVSEVCEISEKYSTDFIKKLTKFRDETKLITTDDLMKLLNSEVSDDYIAVLNKAIDKWLVNKDPGSAGVIVRRIKYAKI